MKLFKRFIACVSATVMCLSCMTINANAITDASSSYLKGDVNGDGTINGTDVVALSNFLLGKNSASSIDTKIDKRLDVDRNGVINQLDLTSIKNIVLGTASTTTLSYTNTYTLPSQESRLYYVYNNDGSFKKSYTLSSVSNISTSSSDASVCTIIDGDDRELETGINGVVHMTSIGGTAFVVDSHTLLTAAHCVVNQSGKYCNSNIELTFNEGESNEFTIYPSEVHVPYKYYTADDNSPNYDYALITVEQDLSDYVCFELGVATNSAEGITISMTGYGGGGTDVNEDLIDVMSTGTGIVEKLEDYKIYYDADTIGGDSGGPVYLSKNSGKTVIAIHTTSGASNGGIRITTDILHFVYNNSNLSY